MGTRRASPQTPAGAFADSTEQAGTPLRLRVTAAAETHLRSGHPWVFAESVRTQSRPGKPGDLAVVYDRKNRFLALGLFDPLSAIRVRVLCRKPRRVDELFWSEKLQFALDFRQGLFDAHTTGYRWVHGESDGWPGLVLDRYDTTLVLKLYTAAWLPWLAELALIIESKLKPERLVLRLSRNIQRFAQEHFRKMDGAILSGVPLVEPVLFQESGLGFAADVVRGQKTGFFLDQRENRRRVEKLAQGRAVLNAFSFSGGFSLYAARGGARAVTDLDLSAHALAAAKRNFALNSSDARVRSCPHESIQADAFEWLASDVDQKFGLIVLDPPSLAKRETERARAIVAYRRLAANAIKRLRRSGILVACSCSAHVSGQEFFETVRAAAGGSGRGWREIDRTGQPPDHPAKFKEAQYLKALYLQF